LSQIKFSIQSEPDMIKFDTYPIGIFQTFGLQDSIYQPYPTSVIQVLDDSSKFSEEYFYTQNLDLKMKVSDLYNKTSNLDHNYYLDNQNYDVSHSEFLFGSSVLNLHSSLRKQDSVKSKSFKGNISDIVKSIISKYIATIGPPKTYVTTTSNLDTWYQSNRYDFSFIQLLSNYALSVQNANSPFYTFFNLKGEFYFQSVVDLFAQSPVDTYYYGLNSKNNNSTFVLNQLSRNLIKNVKFEPLTSADMMDEYNITFYKVNGDGSYSNKGYDIKTKISENKLFNNKLTIRKQDIDKVRGKFNYGLIENDKQENHYKGWTNRQFINSISFPYRLNCATQFDTRLCSGKLIELKFKSPSQDKNNESLEFSGNWLILQSNHIFNEKGIGYTNLLLGKSSINVFKKHKIYNDFI